MKAPKNVKLFTNSESYEKFSDGADNSDKKLMLSLLREMHKDLNIICINGKTLQSIQEQTVLSVSQIRNSTSKLSNLGLLSRTFEMPAEYQVSPTFATKGDHRLIYNIMAQIEKKRGNMVLIPYSYGVVLYGVKLPLKDEDFAQVGRMIMGIL
jgi:hypothetical protein